MAASSEISTGGKPLRKRHRTKAEKFGPNIKRVYVYFPSDRIPELEAAAAIEGCSVSAYLSRATMDYIAKTQAARKGKD